MRRITVILMSIAALAFASSCNKNINPETPGDGLVYKTIHLSASEVLTNKAAFGEKDNGSYPLLWSSGDKVIICVNNDPDLTQELSVTPLDGGKSAEFGECTLALPASGEITIRVTTNTTTASGGTAATVKYSPDMDKSQAPQAASCDPESIILFAKETYASAAVVPGNIALSFSHATAYGLMTISGIDLGGETVKFVEIQAMSPDIKIAGNVTLDGDGILSSGSHTSLTMRGITDLSSPIWFAIAPSELNTASALAIHVVTSGDRHFEKILDCSSNPLKFQAGRISKFGVNFSGISSAPRQVKTARDFVLLKNAINNDDYSYWLNGSSDIMLANDIDYAGASFAGTASLPAGVTFNGQNHAIKNAIISATIFKTVDGTVKDLKVQNCTFEIALFNSISSTGIVDGFIVDGGSYTCKWSSNNMGIVTSTNNGIIKNSEVSSTITIEDPDRTSFFFGVFCPKCTDGQFINCVNKSDVSCSNSHYTRNSGIGGIVGLINSTQSNSVNILDECRNEGNISLTIGAGTAYSRVCCVGGIAGGNYKGGYDAAPWKEASMPSTGLIYKCKNEGAITLNWNSTYKNAGSDTEGSQGASAGGIIGATVNDIVECINVGAIVANFNVGQTGSTETTAAPKVGGIVGCAHNRVVDCINGDSADSSKGAIEVNGRVRNINSAIYNGTGPISFPCIGGVAGAVGCNDAANSTAAGSEISGCKNYSASITDNSTVTAGTNKYVGSVCGWTVASNSNNADLGGTSWPVLNPQ
ncbi:MAG: hypothetical protein J5640_03305 [Bacteroidales bacterium]|nr:hypothetical protein [Bacteroidales bacterium]